MTLAWLQLALNSLLFVLACICCWLAFRRPRPPK